MLTKPALRHLLALSLQTRYVARGTSMAEKQRWLWRECTSGRTLREKIQELDDAFKEALMRRAAAPH